MNTNYGRALCAALLMTIAVAMPGGLALARSSAISIQSGHSVIISVPGITRVAIGDGKIAGVVPIGTNQLIINGKDAGTTSVFVWSAGRRLTYMVTVTNQTLNSIAGMLRAAIPDPGVDIVDFGHAIVVRGTVPDMSRFVTISDILSRFTEMAKREKYDIVNAVTVTHSLDSLQQEFSNSPSVHDLSIEPDGKGNIIVSGYVEDQVQEEQVIARARALAGPYLAADGKVIDRLQLARTSQISIRVYVLEIDKTGLGDLGLELQSGVPDPNNPNSIQLEPPSFPIIEGAAGLLGKALNIAPFFRTVRLVPTLNLVLQSGHARMLSEPNLVTVPGSPATFLVGGEIPYVYSTGIGQTSVDWKNYGVQLNVTPTLLPNGSVESVITPDISNLDYQDAVQLNGFYIPALKESKLSTDIITAPGQSIIMGGLINRVSTRTISKIPILSSIPILGKLFQSTNYQNSQTDVVFILTPEIISQ